MAYTKEQKIAIKACESMLNASFKVPTLKEYGVIYANEMGKPPRFICKISACIPLGCKVFAIEHLLECPVIRHVAEDVPMNVLETIILMADDKDKVDMARLLYSYKIKKEGIL